MSLTTSSLGKRNFKIMFLGESNTGKTSIIERYVNNKFQEKENATIGIDFLGKNVTHKQIACRLQLWDTAGQQRFRSLIPSYLKDALCTIFVFDLSNPQSLSKLPSWIDLFQQNKSDDAVTIVCGNKCDKQKCCNIESVTSLCEKYNMPYFQTSALQNSGISNMFHEIIDTILDKKQKKKKKYEQIDLMAPLTNETLKSSTKQSVTIKVIKGEKKQQQSVKPKKTCCC